jgi:hypothetical protein
MCRRAAAPSSELPRPGPALQEPSCSHACIRASRCRRVASRHSRAPRPDRAANASRRAALGRGGPQSHPAGAARNASGDITSRRRAFAAKRRERRWAGSPAPGGEPPSQQSPARCAAPAGRGRPPPHPFSLPGGRSPLGHRVTRGSASTSSLYSATRPSTAGRPVREESRRCATPFERPCASGRRPLRVQCDPPRRFHAGAR